MFELGILLLFVTLLQYFYRLNEDGDDPNKSVILLFFVSLLIIIGSSTF